MQTRSRMYNVLLGFSLVLIGVLNIALTAGSAQADTGTLKLMVASCQTGEWLSDAQIDVLIYRPGVGQVDSGSGYTNSTGEFDMTFTSLVVGDQARVTVTPKNGSPDSGHVYYWASGSGDQLGGVFDINSIGDSICMDGWYDQGKDIIKCRCH
jgi:hypothetical protein